MPTINGRACVVDGKPVDKVYSNGRQIYGRNMLLGTSSTNVKTLAGTGWVLGSSASNANFIPVLAGEKFTYSAVITNLTFESHLEMSLYDGNKHRIDGGTIRLIGVPGVYYVAYTIPANCSFMSVHVVINNPSTPQSVSFIKEKLVRGDYDGIYTPAPEDVM